MRGRNCHAFVLAIACLWAFAAVAAAQTRPDSSHGSGGSKSWSKVEQDDATVETETFRDKTGTVREQITTTFKKDGVFIETCEWFDESGKKTRETMETYDPWYDEEYWRDEQYENGVLTSGEVWEDTDETNHKRRSLGEAG